MAAIQDDDDLVFHKICSLLEPLNHKGVKLTRDTDFVVRVADVQPDGRALFLCEGILRARYRLGLDRTPSELADAHVTQAKLGHPFRVVSPQGFGPVFGVVTDAEHETPLIRPSKPARARRLRQEGAVPKSAAISPNARPSDNGG